VSCNEVFDMKNFVVSFRGVCYLILRIGFSGQVDNLEAVVLL
jgi:hypothetical protein